MTQDLSPEAITAEIARRYPPSIPEALLTAGPGVLVDAWQEAHDGIDALRRELDQRIAHAESLRQVLADRYTIQVPSLSHDIPTPSHRAFSPIERDDWEAATTGGTAPMWSESEPAGAPFDGGDAMDVNAILRIQRPLSGPMGSPTGVSPLGVDPVVAGLAQSDDGPLSGDAFGAHVAGMFAAIQQGIQATS